MLSLVSCFKYFFYGFKRESRDQDGIDEDQSHKFLVWQLKTQPSLNNGGNSLLELAHEETMFYSSPFTLRECFVSGNYIVSVLARKLQNEDGDDEELLIEVRSTTDFCVVYSIKESIFFSSCFNFAKDILTVQMVCLNKGVFIRYS